MSTGSCAAPERVFRGALKKNKISHAYILCGENQEAALAMVRDLFFALSNKDAKALPDVDKKNHPDWFEIGSIEGEKIKIEAVKEFGKIVRRGPVRAPYLFFLVHQAEKLTREAVAAFLKVLEEPLSPAVFFLITGRESFLPSTILSRCQILHLPDKPEVENKDFPPHIIEAFGCLAKKDGAGFLKVADMLYNNREEINPVLDDFLFFLHKACLKDLANKKWRQAIAIVLEAKKEIEKGAHLRLVLDLLALDLGGILSGAAARS